MLIVVWRLIEPVWPKSNLRDTVQLALALAAVGGFVYFGRYYSCRFGRVTQRGGAAWAAAFFIAWLAAAWLDSMSPPISIASLFLALFFAATAIASRGLRSYAFVPAAAFLVLTVLPLTGTMTMETVDGHASSIVLGLALVFMGLLDHLVLVRNLAAPADA